MVKQLAEISPEVQPDATLVKRLRRQQNSQEVKELWDAYSNPQVNQVIVKQSESNPSGKRNRQPAVKPPGDTTRKSSRHQTAASQEALDFARDEQPPDIDIQTIFEQIDRGNKRTQETTVKLERMKRQREQEENLKMLEKQELARLRAELARLRAEASKAKSTQQPSGAKISEEAPPDNTLSSSSSVLCTSSPLLSSLQQVLAQMQQNQQPELTGPPPPARQQQAHQNFQAAAVNFTNNDHTRLQRLAYQQSLQLQALHGQVVQQSQQIAMETMFPYAK